MVEKRIDIWSSIEIGKKRSLNPENDQRFKDNQDLITSKTRRTPDLARSAEQIQSYTRGEADSMICGTFGQYLWHLKYIKEIFTGQYDLWPTLRHTPIFRRADFVVAAASACIEPKIALCSLLNLKFRQRLESE